jgi:hypothetical protein
MLTDFEEPVVISKGLQTDMKYHHHLKNSHWFFLRETANMIPNILDEG